MATIQLSKQQINLIDLGKTQREALEKSVIDAISSCNNGRRRHTLVYSPTGLGKTFVFKKVLDEMGVQYAVISGKQSLFQISLNLMVLWHLKPKGEQLIILFDDCDIFFTKQELMNVLKNMIEGEHALTYNVNVIESQLTPVQLEAYNRCKNPYGRGFSVPCDEFTFMVTTNFMLPFDIQADIIRKKDGSSAKADKIESLAAFRSRFRTKDYPMDKNTKWGYLAYVMLELDLFDELDLDSRKILMDWIWANWDKMKETNLRTLEKMAEDMLNNPTEYKNVWEADYLMFDFNY